MCFRVQRDTSSNTYTHNQASKRYDTHLQSASHISYASSQASSHNAGGVVHPHGNLHRSDSEPQYGLGDDNLVHGDNEHDDDKAGNRRGVVGCFNSLSQVA